MNENINLVEILKDCPEGTKFYSSVYGELIYSSMHPDLLNTKIYFINENIRSTINESPLVIGYYRDGRLYATKGECTIFPSKDQRDWSKFKVPVKKFDPRTLHPFDKVIVRLEEQTFWTIDFFSFIETKNVKCVGGYFNRCIPYNDDTKYLVGTTNEAPEYYRYWEN